MNKSQAQELVDKQKAFAAGRTFFDFAPGVNGAQHAKAERILSGVEAEDEPPLTDPVTSRAKLEAPPEPGFTAEAPAPAEAPPPADPAAPIVPTEPGV